MMFSSVRSTPVARATTSMPVMPYLVTTLSATCWAFVDVVMVSRDTLSMLYAQYVTAADGLTSLILQAPCDDVKISTTMYCRRYIVEVTI